MRDILAETVRLVAQVDFPDEWPDLVPTVVTQLQTGEVLRYEILGVYFVVAVVVLVVVAARWPDRGYRQTRPSTTVPITCGSSRDFL